MKDFIELAGITLIVVCAALGVILLATLPFAFVGWVVMTIINIFTIVSASYFDCVAVGIGVAIVSSLISQAKPK